MAVRSNEEIMTMIKERIGDDTDDATITFIEDINDTLNDYSTRVADTTNWRQKYEENDAEWRRKYRDRFFGADNPEDEVIEDTEEVQKPTKFEDLFKEVE